MDPNVCRFSVNQPIYASGAVKCKSADDANGSPLLEQLFAIDGITEVVVLGNSLTIAKSSEEEWPVIGKQIGKAIRSTLAADEPPIDPDLNKKSTSEEGIREKVQELFDSQINPAIASHGGHVQLVDVQGTSIHLIMGGGCQGCASAQMTLRQGIERAIREHIPEVSEVVDVTDHAAGANPYYQ
jgi:Fe-S cluster biogenesis protein NfuA